MKMTNYTLPEFVFLDGNSHLGDSLEGRDVMMHIRTATVLEIVAMDNVKASAFKSKTHKFTYKNHFGVTETHLFAVHFTMAEDDDLPEIFAKCEKWYCGYLRWEDHNIISDDLAQNN